MRELHSFSLNCPTPYLARKGGITKETKETPGEQGSRDPEEAPSLDLGIVIRSNLRRDSGSWSCMLRAP
jgi:hypothetical protein